jgi:hypothetical protein
MARARNIKPSIMDNPDLAELDPIARLLFIYLWMIADRSGRLEDDARRIRAKTFPYEPSISIEEQLELLHQSGFTLRYEVDNCKYIQIVNFEKHQSPHCKEKDSTIPAPDKNQTSTILAQKRKLPAPPDSLIPDTGLSDVTRHHAVPVRKRTTQAPTSLPVTDGLRIWATDHRITVDLEAETDKMLDHFRGNGKPMKDWEATRRNWLRKAQEWAVNNPHRGNGIGHGDDDHRPPEADGLSYAETYDFDRPKPS